MRQTGDAQCDGLVGYPGADVSQVALPTAGGEGEAGDGKRLAGLVNEFVECFAWMGVPCGTQQFYGKFIAAENAPVIGVAFGQR